METSSQLRVGVEPSCIFFFNVDDVATVSTLDTTQRSLLIIFIDSYLNNMYTYLYLYNIFRRVYHIIYYFRWQNIWISHFQHVEFWVTSRIHIQCTVSWRHVLLSLGENSFSPTNFNIDSSNQSQDHVYVQGLFLGNCDAHHAVKGIFRSWCSSYLYTVTEQVLGQKVTFTEW